MRERSDRSPLFLVFKSVPGCIEGIPGHYLMFRGIMGCSGALWDVPGVFWGVPGVFRGCSGVFRVLQTPDNFYRTVLIRLNISQLAIKRAIERRR